MKTIIKKIDEHQIDAKIIEQAGIILKNGGLVAFPTETVYGLGADALNPMAAMRTYAAKGRPSDNPLIVHVADIQALEEIVVNPPSRLQELAYHFWPGPLTIIFEKSEKVPYETTGGLETVAVRMPENLIARELIIAGGGFISAPSCNTSGRPSPTTAKHVIEDMDGKIDMILDGGPVDIGMESTILDMTVTPPMILRPGAITQEMLENVLGEVAMADMPADGADEQPDEAPRAPGMKYRHYAPKGQLTIVEGEPEEVVKAIQQIAYQYNRIGHKIGIIATNESAQSYPLGVVKSVGARENEKAVARNLYAVLREFDDEEIEFIYSESFPQEGLGYAIMNRLSKAAGFRTQQAADITRLQRYRQILFVSSSDNCRGPMAAALLKQQQLIQGYEIGSRGLVVLFPEPMNPKAQEIFKQQGIEIENHEATALTAEDFLEDTLVLTMEESQKWKIISEYEFVKHVYTLDEYIGGDQEVLSTYGQPLEKYEDLYWLLKEKVEQLANRLNEEAKN